MPSMMFGCILSATDPVAVVALLRELGTMKLDNDGLLCDPQTSNNKITHGPCG